MVFPWFAAASAVGSYLNYSGQKDAMRQQKAMMEAEQKRQAAIHTLQSEKEKLWGEQRIAGADEKKRQKGIYDSNKQQLYSNRNVAVENLMNEYQGEGGKLRPHLDDMDLMARDPSAYYTKLNDLMEKSPYGERTRKDTIDMDRMGGDRAAVTGRDWSDNARKSAAKNIWQDGILGFNNQYDKKQNQAIQTILAEMQGREERDINTPYRQQMEEGLDRYETNVNHVNDLVGIEGNQIDRGRALEGMYNTGPNVTAISNLIQQKADNNNQMQNNLLSWVMQNSGANSESEDALQDIKTGVMKKELGNTMGPDFAYGKAFPKKKYLIKDLLEGNFLDSLRNKGIGEEKQNYNFGSR